ncbi:MAG: radical SAM family heme chaperone HemW, partial [Bacteroidales bacterium]|nr:radical SAM family heme chaperone HemW [Bacteroidales bacterium]
MGGIYIHIPFCLSRCSYCDFYSVTDIRLKEEWIRALLHEMELERDFFKHKPVDTLYIGGGTPSLLTQEEIIRLIEKVKSIFQLDDHAEITMEANPEDLSPSCLQQIRESGVNRMSIGIQSIYNRYLTLMNRRHDEKRVREVFKWIRQMKETEFSIDLIYGLPGMTQEEWIQTIREISELKINHISAYHITYEKGTELYRMIRDKKLNETSEEESFNQYAVLVTQLKENGYEHYEISNFARKEQYSRHNMKYWTGEQYLGLGPSAHSYDGEKRYWNKPDVHQYIKLFGGAQLPDRSEVKKHKGMEIINEMNRWNEYVMTRLRTQWGMNRREITAIWGAEQWNYVRQKSEPYIKNGDMKITRDRI